MADNRKIGEVILDLQNISLAFGGVKALTNISFNVREHEIRAIIGPNGAGKSSMLNVINGVYRPQQGDITYRGQHRKDMNTYAAAKSGIARTFQNIALFKGMSVLDNIMTGRNLKMKSNFLMQALYWGPAQEEEIAHREKVEEIIDFLEIQHIRKTPVGRLSYGLQKRVELGRALAAEPEISAARRTHGGHERRGKAGHVPLHPRRQRPVRHHHRFDRTRHGRGHGHLRPRGRARLRQARSATARPTKCAATTRSSTPIWASRIDGDRDRD